MNRTYKRHDPTPRFGVTHHCRGRVVHGRSGVLMEFKGVDVSLHGFGCVIIGNVESRDTLVLEFNGFNLAFEVMWVESHLGIENTYRVGLQCLDRLLDVRGRMTTMGYVTSPIEDGFVA